MTTLHGGIFSQQLPDGRAGAEITISRERLLAKTRDGQTFELDPANCTLELGGASGRMWFCRSSDGSLTLFSEDVGMGPALADVPRLREGVQAILAKRRGKRWRSTSTATVSMVLIAALVFACYLGLRKGLRSAVLSLPESADERIGEMAINSMDLGGPVVEIPAVKDSVQAIVDRLDSYDQAKFHYHVRVVRAPITNAFALPGGEIVVYTGLLTAAPNAEAVAGVLAHEIGHVVKRHGLERIAQSVGIAAAFQMLVGDVAGLSALGVQLLREGALMSYGRDQEREADRVGMQIMQRAGIDPQNLAVIFRILQKQHDDPPAALAWLSSHPGMSERIATVERAAKSLRPTTLRPLDVHFAELRAALGAPLPQPTPPDSTGEKEQLDGK